MKHISNLSLTIIDLSIIRYHYQQSIKQSINQTINQTIYQSINLIDHHLSLLTRMSCWCWSVGGSIGAPSLVVGPHSPLQYPYSLRQSLVKRRSVANHVGSTAASYHQPADQPSLKHQPTINSSMLNTHRPTPTSTPTWSPPQVMLPTVTWGTSTTGTGTVAGRSPGRPYQRCPAAAPAAVPVATGRREGWLEAGMNGLVMGWNDG